MRDVLPYRRRFVLGLLPPLILFFCTRLPLRAQDGRPPPPPFPPKHLAPRMRERAIILHMVTRVLESDNTEAWNSDAYKVTIPGRPVGLKIVGENVAVSVQFTPYQRRNGKGILVAQGQIFTETPDGGVQCRTMMQTLPFDFGEQIFFFPLGSGRPGDDAHIEIQIEMTRYDGIPVNGLPPDKGPNDPSE